MRQKSNWNWLATHWWVPTHTLGTNEIGACVLQCSVSAWNVWPHNYALHSFGLHCFWSFQKYRRLFFAHSGWPLHLVQESQTFFICNSLSCKCIFATYQCNIVGWFRHTAKQWCAALCSDLTGSLDSPAPSSPHLQNRIWTFFLSLACKGSTTVCSRVLQTKQQIMVSIKLGKEARNY